MSHREQSLTLIRDISVGAVYDLELMTRDVNLETHGEGSASPKTKAISEYLLGRDNNANCLFKFHPNVHYDQLWIRAHKGFVKYAGELLPVPFLEIGIVREYKDGHDYPNNPEDLVVFEKRIPLQAFVDMENIDDSDGTDHHLIIIPFENGYDRKRIFFYTIKLGWIEPPTKFKMCTATLLEKVFDDDDSKDLTIIAGNGAEVKCHTMIFAAHTLAFSAMLSAKTGMEEENSRKVDMRENSEIGIRKLVQYLYGLELDVSDMSSDVALELFQTGHKYGLAQLESSILEVFHEKKREWFTPDGLLEMYFYVRNLDGFEKLREHAIFLMARTSKEEICSCEVFKKLDKSEAEGVCSKVVDFVKTQDIHKVSTSQVEVGSVEGLPIN